MITRLFFRLVMLAIAAGIVALISWVLAYTTVANVLGVYVDLLVGDLKQLQRLARDRRLLTHQSEQEVLGTYVVVPKVSRLL